MYYDDMRAHPRVCHEESEGDLYRTVVEARQEKLRGQLQKVAGQKAFLRHEKRRLMLQRALLESEIDRFHAASTSDWFCHDAFVVGGARLRLQVGGHDFELSHALAKRDPKSLLAAMVAADSPLQASDVGGIAIDRDGMLFRHVLNFLRDGLLPNDPKVLKALYIEGDFWKLTSLKLAIEESKIQLKAAQTAVDTTKNGVSSSAHDKGGGDTRAAKPAAGAAKPWWSEPPQWWGKPPTKPAEPKKEEKPDMYSWWKGSKYKGNDYAKFLCDDQFVPLKQPAPPSASAKKDEPYPALRSTWTSYRHLA
ncbi:hypothetical protein SPRG_08906 [Saprolegnia parasitica CBS 223.65]|uniref:Potassium channel tetramerisation-type BTB domain-containing protein n=1 Tax=Saprolegnia parasitica (strain CBS 223.65) TaxID=695850 RepID=A0A067CFM5_SAPPC|nr:hypothetical protein SPRG_08906 [Saprolegnia parasitica CBS 223.65]KDO25607.1 hypothetical protein SPRG_08906 [Saprolegnia parasitica CBS 223.65]|eukprot:XP_012203641.1 hypothetical protein SPRG_08906 [Saprolegnia parasitica CBS 223.65]